MLQSDTEYNLDRLGNAQTANEYAVTTENRSQVLLDEWDEDASTNHIWNDMETYMERVCR